MAKKFTRRRKLFWMESWLYLETMFKRTVFKKD